MHSRSETKPAAAKKAEAKPVEAKPAAPKAVFSRQMQTMTDQSILVVQDRRGVRRYFSLPQAKASK